MKFLHVFFWCSVVTFFAVFVWVSFDIHNRLPFALMAQVPIFLCRAGLRIGRSKKP